MPFTPTVSVDRIASLLVQARESHFGPEHIETLNELARLVELLQERNRTLRHQVSRALVSERAQYRAEQRLREAHAALEIANARLQHESTTDYLTGIANRRVFCELAEQAAQEHRPWGLILIDIDDFKSINDTYGHEIGDQVLSTVGSLLKQSLCARTEVCSRIGGEEFAVLCFGPVTEDTLRELAETVRGDMAREVVQSTRGPVRFSCSLGLALSYPEDVGWKNIYSRADAALYEAKASGKNRVVYGRAMLKGATGRFKSLRAVANE